MSQFFNPVKMGVLAMVNTVRGHSGMDNIDAPSINKVRAIAASTLKMEKALLLRLSVPRPFCDVKGTEPKLNLQILI